MDQGRNKMSTDLKQYCWWNNLKREIAEYVEALEFSRDQA